MASDAQESGPLPGTGPSAKFTQGLWVTHFGHETGIFGDTNGSAFGITLPPSGDVAEIGSASIDSIAKVGGFPLRIPAGETQSLEIPPSLTGGAVGRTDLITARLNTGSFTTAPGPVRLHRIEGTEGSATRPAFDSTLPSPFDITIWAITRKQGEALNQATVVDLRKRTGRHYLVPALASLPANAPLGSTATRAGIRWRRDFDGSTVDWIQETIPRVVLTGAATATDGDDWDVLTASRLSQEGVKRWANLVINLAGDPVNPDPTVDGERRVARLAAADRPAASVSLLGFAENTAGIKRAAAGRIDPDGWVIWHWASTTNRFPTGSTITLTGPWELNA